jgi:mono/diheme cytochrome c family protein
MSSRAVAVVVALLLLLASQSLGCGSEQASRKAPPAQRQQLQLGARVFAEHCRTCHPLGGRPNTHIHTDYAPALDLDQVAPTPAYARERVRLGGVGMGAFEGVLSAAEQRAVVDYVLAVGGRETSVPRGAGRAEMARGRAIYGNYCQSCHELAGRPATDPNPDWIGTDFDDVRPGVLLIERLVREGLREAMPSFRERLSLRQTRAVALYLNAAARGGAAARP